MNSIWERKEKHDKYSPYTVVALENKTKQNRRFGTLPGLM